MKSASSYVLSFFPILITCIINYFLLIMMRWYFFTYIYFIHYFIVDTNTWIYLRLFLQSNYCFKLTFGLNVDMRKVWISYNIITVWCIIIIWFYIVDVWVNISTSPLLRLGKNLPAMFYSWRRKRHNYLF